MGGGIEQKSKKKKELMYMDNSVVIAGGVAGSVGGGGRGYRGNKWGWKKNTIKNNNKTRLYHVASTLLCLRILLMLFNPHTQTSHLLYLHQFRNKETEAQSG